MTTGQASVWAILRRFRQPAILLAAVVLYGTVGFIVIEGWSPFDALFATLTTISTIGFTGLQPLTLAGRVFTMTLIIGGVGSMLYAFGLFAEVLSEDEFGKYRRTRQLERSLAMLKEHYIVCGYGRIGTQIATEFESHRVPYVIVEQNPEAIGRLEAENRLFVRGDAASEDVLKRAGIERARCLISAVDSDERAVYVVLAARGLQKDLYVVARAGRPESIRRLELAGADRVISPYRMAGHRMAELAIRPALVDVLESLGQGDAEVGLEELLVAGDSGLAGKTLAEAALLESDGARLLALRRIDGTLHVNPGQDLVLQEGDLIIALGSADQLALTAARLQ